MPADSDGYALYYNSDLITNLQLRWGEGFLSPGGEPELARMLRNIDLDGQIGLDFGCGIGGYDTLLVKNHGVANVIGSDIDAAKLEKARSLASEQGLDGQLEFKEVESGPLSFDDDTFDFVFSKDSIVELPEKVSIFQELFRVAKSGGRIVVSDWFRSDEPYTEEMRVWATTGDETYDMDSLKTAANCISQAGFVDCDLDDRNDWFREFSRDEYERIKGPLYATYVEKFGEEYTKESIENARIRNLLAEQGQLRPGHIRARKP